MGPSVLQRLVNASVDQAIKVQTLCNKSLGMCYRGWLCHSSFSLGQLCDRPCDGRSFGNDCGSKCNCLNGASCHPVTGACLCPAGFGGLSCELGCKPGTYGSGCALQCNCNENNTLKCDPLTGECVCKTSWQGKCFLPKEYEVTLLYICMPLQVSHANRSARLGTLGPSAKRSVVA